MVINDYDVAVIGGGHAGIEAALACARLGIPTVLFTMSLDAIGNMPCNPSIGGTAKGHLVCEIDALGGEMGRAADATMLQMRMLNMGKGPAVQSLRAQSDRREYGKYMKSVLEKTPMLDIKQCEITGFSVKGGAVKSVTTHLGAVYNIKSLVIASGTYLKSRVIVGESFRESGPDGMFPAKTLSNSLKRAGVKLMRFKTGTPARVAGSSIDFNKLEIQPWDEENYRFSADTGRKCKNKKYCYIAYTNEDTHRIIRENLHRSPLYSGKIEGIGPRYCPSIEDKIVKFPDKSRHQIFVEPTGLNSDEMYIQGMSSSMPEDVQIAMYRSIKGFENCKFMRTAYAIEYDCVDPLELKSTLELRKIDGVFCAGQISGSSGYEEAAAQGIVAGINAALKIKKLPPLILDRSSSYIGTLIDDLVTKGTNEPYRMMTSRSEYRLALRQDNADERLTPIGYEIGLISKARYRKFCRKQGLIEKEIKRLGSTTVSPTPALVKIFTDVGFDAPETGFKLLEILRRPAISYEALFTVDKERPRLPDEVKASVEIRIKYEGYINKQNSAIAKFKKLEGRKIPEGIDYSDVRGLRIEAKQKLSKIRPENVGRASRISGVSPADITVLLIYLDCRKHGG